MHDEFKGQERGRKGLGVIRKASLRMGTPVHLDQTGIKMCTARCCYWRLVVIRECTHQDLFTRYPIEDKPTRITPYQALWHPFCTGGVPYYFGCRESFADCVKNIWQR